MFRQRLRFIVPALSLLAFLPASASHAAGQWNGQDLLHVPISWCIVQGSPAETSPNVAGDTTTNHPSAEVEEEVGDLLFAVANLSRKLGVEPETALRRANDKFARRFTELERRVTARGDTMKDTSLDALEAEWQRVKADQQPR